MNHPGDNYVDKYRMRQCTDRQKNINQAAIFPKCFDNVQS